ncbi:unnamed protein product, partial [marine sediment metagenome]
MKEEFKKPLENIKKYCSKEEFLKIEKAEREKFNNELPPSIP